MRVRMAACGCVASALLVSGCGGYGSARSPAPAAPAFELSDASETYGGCADPIRVSAAPPADESAAIALVRGFVERLRGPEGEPVRARRLGPGACANVADPALTVLDFWLVGGRTLVIAPYAPGAPEPPAGFTLLSV